MFKHSFPVSSETVGKSVEWLTLIKLTWYLKRNCKKVMGLALLSALGIIINPKLVNALPLGGRVSAGQAQIDQVSATQLNINQSTDRAVINWNSFNVAQPEQVNFQQPGSNSATLNRVTSATPSNIAGQINANGQVMLVNPNGILLTRTANVNVGGFIASTLNITDGDFMGKVLNFNQMPGQPIATVENQGKITVRDSGFAALVAPGVVNSGIINAKLGQVALASGTSATLDFYGDGLVSVAVDPRVSGQIIGSDGKPLTALVTNSGTINAKGGTVTLTAESAGAVVDNVINMSGVIKARSTMNQNGSIVLSGGDSGKVLVSGSLDVSGGSGKTGGSVQVLGNQVSLSNTAQINASGDVGGGTVLVGGDYQGQGDIPTAQATTVASGALITADALTNGDGGTVVVWSDEDTQFGGIITAQGGSQSGNGGLVETSGLLSLVVDPSAQVNAAAPKGQAGTWLLDPRDINIANSGGNVTPTTITDQLNKGTNVVISTSKGKTGSGDITLTDSINQAGGGAASLTLTGREFLLPGNATINMNSTGGLVFNLNQVNPEAIVPTSSIQNANDAIGTVKGPVAINLGAGTFEGATLDLTHSLTLNGATTETTILDGENKRQVMNIDKNADITISNLTIQNGRVEGADGGGIFINKGSSLTINSGSISGNTAINNSIRRGDYSGGGSGGGISNRGTLIINGGVISENEVSFNGAGVLNNGDMFINDGLITNNRATLCSDGGCYAGGIFNFGTLTITGGTISNNTATNNGGGILNSGNKTNRTISKTPGILVITGGTITGNTAVGSAPGKQATGGFGGGIRNYQGTVEISGGTITGNSAVKGGAISNTSVGTINFSAGTIAGNTATNGGAISNDNTSNLSSKAPGQVTISGGTITGNTATGSGGAIVNTSSNVTITGGTIAGNTAKQGGGIFSTGGKLNITPGIVTGNTPNDITKK